MKRLILLLPLLVLACTFQTTPAPDNVKPVDPPIVPTPDTNGAACKRFEELGCQSRDGRNLWEPTPGGVTCPEVFANAEKNGVNLHPECIAKMKSCDEREACSTQQ